MTLTYRQMQAGAARLYFDELGQFCKWNVNLMARIAGVNRPALYRILHKYDVKIDRPPTTRERVATKSRRLAKQFLRAPVISH